MEDLPHNTHSVALSVKNETEIKSICDKLVKACVPLRPIMETDGQYEGQLMAIGLAPCTKESVKRYLSCLPLVRDPSTTGCASSLMNLKVVGSSPTGRISAGVAQ